MIDRRIFLKYEDVVKTIKEEIEGSEVCMFRALRVEFVDRGLRARLQR